MSLLQRMFPWVGKSAPPALIVPPSVDTTAPNESAPITSERGYRTTPENAVKYAYRLMWVDPDIRQAILDVREMDRIDGRVKKIHGRVARDIIRGGLVFPTENQTLRREWDAFTRRLQLNFAEKLKSDARGIVMEGNLPMQWVIDTTFSVVAGVRMASETIMPNVGQSGQYKDAAEAHWQIDVMTGTVLAKFPLWQLFMARFDPDNHDDFGSMGRPYLDAARTTWKKLTMTEEDLVIRRRVRAPLRLAHVLEGASKEQLDEYRSAVERDQYEITTDYYLNKKGGVDAIAGDSNLDQMADVVYLLDCFFAGSPAPKGLMGFTEGLNRDILEDLKVDYYDEIDAIQETLAFVYESGFRLHLLLKGINPGDDVCVKFAQRRTETPNATADRALKWKALGLPYGMVWEEMGLDPGYVRERVDWEREHWQPYPDPAEAGAGAPGGQKIKITPGNQPKGESATSVSNDVALAEDTLSLSEANPLADIIAALSHLPPEE